MIVRLSKVQLRDRLSDDERPGTQPPDHSYKSPYAMIGGAGSLISYQAIPINELAMRRGDRVEATDSHVGWIDEFLVNPATMGITHLVMREGHLWSQKDVTIPVSQIDRIVDGTVHMRLSKQQIQELPALKVRLPGW